MKQLAQAIFRWYTVSGSVVRDGREANHGD